MEIQPQLRESEPDDELETLRLELLARLEADDDPAIRELFTREEMAEIAGMEMDFEATFAYAHNLMTCAGIDADDYWAEAGIAAPAGTDHGRRLVDESGGLDSGSQRPSG